MKSIPLQLLVFLTFLVSTNSYSQNIVTTTDLKALLGEWTGTLTYMDYSTNKPFTMATHLSVINRKNDHHLILDITYPTEPNANSKDKLKLSKDGTQLNDINITSKIKLPHGQTKITTQYLGNDNGKRALIKNIYIIGVTEFIMRKEVKFENSDVWLMRNEYQYSR